MESPECLLFNGANILIPNFDAQKGVAPNPPIIEGVHPIDFFVNWLFAAQFFDFLLPNFGLIAAQFLTFFDFFAGPYYYNDLPADS